MNGAGRGRDPARERICRRRSSTWSATTASRRHRRRDRSASGRAGQPLPLQTAASPTSRTASSASTTRSRPNSATASGRHTRRASPGTTGSGPRGWAAMRFLQEDPLRARFLARRVNGAGSGAQARRDRLMQGSPTSSTAAAARPASRPPMSRCTAEIAAGAIYGTVLAKIESGAIERGEEFLPELIYMAVMPYLGSRAAEDELPSSRCTRAGAASVSGIVGPWPRGAKEAEERRKDESQAAPAGCLPAPARRPARPAARVHRPEPARADRHGAGRHRRRARLQRDHRRPHHQGRLGLAPHLLRALRRQGGVLPRRLRDGRRPHPRLDAAPPPSPSRTGRRRCGRRWRRCCASSPASPSWPASA